MAVMVAMSSSKSCGRSRVLGRSRRERALSDLSFALDKRTGTSERSTEVIFGRALVSGVDNRYSMNDKAGGMSTSCMQKVFQEWETPRTAARSTDRCTGVDTDVQDERRCITSHCSCRPKLKPRRRAQFESRGETKVGRECRIFIRTDECAQVGGLMDRRGGHAQ